MNPAVRNICTFFSSPPFSCQIASLFWFPIQINTTDVYFRPHSHRHQYHLSAYFALLSCFVVVVLLLSLLLICEKTDSACVCLCLLCEISISKNFLIGQRKSQRISLLPSLSLSSSATSARARPHHTLMSVCSEGFSILSGKKKNDILSSYIARTS